MKIPKINRGRGGGSGWVGGGVRVDVNEEVKLLGKLKKNRGGGGSGHGGLNKDLKFL